MERKVSQAEADDKAELRKKLLLKLAGLPPSVRLQEGQSLNAALEAWAPAQGFEVVLCTLPLDGEPDFTPFLRFWLARGRVALAKTGPARTLSFHYIEALEGPWEKKPGGLREPLVEAPWAPGPKTLCLVPGLGFARAGDGVVRLGRGGGYYDRWLARFAPSVITLGVGFSVQSVEVLPAEAHDRTLDGWLIASLPLYSSR